MNHLRTVGTMTAAVGIAAVGVLAFAAPATAATGDSVTINNQSSLTVRTSKPLDIAATAQPTCTSGVSRTVSLTLAGPNGPDPSTRTLTTTSKPCVQPVSLGVTIHAPKRNGAYTVTLRNGSDTRTTTATLDVLIPAAAPKHLAVSTVGTIATFRWTANSEPDITSYQLRDSAGDVVASVKPADACKGSHCSSRVDFGSSAAGESKSFRLRALRCGLDCTDRTVKGPNSSAVTATFESNAPPPSTPTSPSSIGGSGGGGTGSGDGTGGGTGGGSSDPSAPASVGGSSPGTGGGSPAAGSSSPPAPPPSSDPTLTSSPAPSPTQSVVSLGGDSGGSSSSRALVRVIGAVVALLLVAAHLGAWASRRRAS